MPAKILVCTESVFARVELGVDHTRIAATAIVSPMYDEKAGELLLNTETPAYENEQKQEAPSVRFSTVTLREYPRILGDNPAGRQGPPLSIGWEYSDEVVLEIDLYEQKRTDRRYAREMIMPQQVRIDILKENGYSMQEIIRLTRPVNITRAQRQRTCETLKLAPIEEVLERAMRKARHAASMGARKRREREFLKPFQSGNRSSTPESNPTNISQLDASMFLSMNDSVEGKRFVF